MYAWKCWRETRARFVILLTAVLSLAAIFVAEVLTPAPHGQFVATVSPAVQADLEMHLLVTGVLQITANIAFLAAFFLGATAVGGELDAGTAEYLWTRPRSRASMSWTHWSVCVAELAVIVFIPNCLAAAVVANRTGDWKQWSLLLGAPVFVFAALPILGLTMLMAALRRSAAGSLIFASGILAGYIFIGIMAERYWNFHLPQLSGTLRIWLPGVHTEGATAFPWGAALRVAALAVVFPLATQYVLKRTEI
jgi:ABC-type transport system involved in multi-copper enzyme maturation permease subunit